MANVGVVTANIRGRISARLSTRRKRSSLSRCRSHPATGDMGGQFEQLISAAQRLQIVIPLALGLILVLLYTIFGNFRTGC